MTRGYFLPGRLSACLVGFAVVAGPLAGSDALAQTVGAPKPQKTQKSQAPAKGGEAAAKPSDKSVAEQAYATGVRAYEAGKLPEAVSALSNALMSGGLPNPQMARALYLRGLCYRQQGQPALAYTDLTSALWLKNGLQDPDRAKAMTEREAVHREAGLGDQAPPIPGGDGGKSKVAAAQPASPAAPKPGVDIASAPTGSNFLNTLNPMNLFSSGSTQQQPAAAVPQPAPMSQPVASAAQAQPAPAAPAGALPATSSWATTGAPAPSAASVPAAAYTEATPQAPQASQSQDPLSSATNAVTGFFGNVFGGAAATSQPSSPVVTASTAAGSPAPALEPAPPASAAVPWSNPDAAAAVEAPAGQVPAPATEKKAAKVKVASAAPGPQAKAIKPSASGKYKLQVATVATREEADKIATTVSQNPLISGAQPEVDSVVYGNMGTFFRVRVGPYASSAQPAELCKQLRPQGYDCLVVTQ